MTLAFRQFKTIHLHCALSQDRFYQLCEHDALSWRNYWMEWFIAEDASRQQKESKNASFVRSSFPLTKLSNHLKIKRWGNWTTRQLTDTRLIIQATLWIFYGGHLQHHGIPYLHFDTATDTGNVTCTDICTIVHLYVEAVTYLSIFQAVLKKKKSLGAILQKIGKPFNSSL